VDDAKLIRIALAEDNPALRLVLTRTLSSDSGFQLLIQAENGQKLLDCLCDTPVDIVLMDVHMPVMDGISATRRIKERYPHTQVIAYTEDDHDTTIVAMHVSGAKSFVSKRDNLLELIKAIRVTASGGFYLTPSVSTTLQRYLAAAQRPDSTRLAEELTPTEKKVLQATVQGRSSSEIGDLINKSPRTVEDIRQRLYQRFNVPNKEQLIAKAVRMGLA
jgi:DNA-binding NarL/FixJ family response regulator